MTVRAAVLIGVDKAGHLPRLKAAAANAERMKDWATSQGIGADRIALLTDRAGEVRMHHISDAVTALLKDGTVQQLIIYFAGHGLVLSRSEYWLLSRAPKAVNEFVNVEASVQLAWTCGVSNVVLFSDACRIAPTTIQSQTISGGNLFPNDDYGRMEGKVDRFFACQQGDPAAEVRGLQDENNFDGVFSNVLIQALYGVPPIVLDYEDSSRSFVRTRRLGMFLVDQVPRVAAQHAVSQQAVSRVTSDDDVWVSRLDTDTPDNSTSVDFAYEKAIFLDIDRSTRLEPIIDPVAGFTEAILAYAISGNEEAILQETARAKELGGDVGSVATGFESLLRVRNTLPGSSKSSGVKVYGAELTRVYSDDFLFKVDMARGLAIGQPGHITYGRMIVELNDSVCIALPALRGMLCSIHFIDGQVAHVSYDDYPSAKRRSYNRRPAVRIVRVIRVAIATALRYGLWEPGGEDIYRITTRMPKIGRIDFSLALYLAYACNQRGDFDGVRYFARLIKEDFGLELFDFALLSRQSERETRVVGDLFARFPLLFHGWSLLPILRDEEKDVMDLSSHLEPSVWTLFNNEALLNLEAMMQRLRSGIQIRG